MALMALVAMAAPPLIPLAIGYWWILLRHDGRQRARRRQAVERAARRQRQADRERIRAWRSL